VLEAAPKATAWPILERDPLPVWSRGRIVLLGDACHPMRPHMGQGAAMAIEDGVMLARCIDHFNGEDSRPIFGLYERMRRERASIVQAGAQTDNWLRHDMGNTVLTTEWLYGYDVLTVPLDADPVAREVVP
jgi:6-hydroxynicotinate 3-monooxygenase